jgi:Ca2+-binding EF-hand superfamily protein
MAGANSGTPPVDTSAVRLELSDLPQKLDVAQQLKLAAQPLMEVVTLAPREGCVRVHRGSEEDAPLVNVTLHRGTRLRVLEVRRLKGERGLKRAHVVLYSETEPVGWITIASLDGSHPVIRPVYARPLYEVVAPPLVRKRYETTSRSLGLLPIGTKLHVVDSRRTSAGGQRVHIVLLGEENPLGWITAKRCPGQLSGWVSIREVPDDDPLLFSPGASPPGSPPASRAVSRPSSARRRRRRSRSPRKLESLGMPATAREQGHASFAKKIAEARAHKQWEPFSSPMASPRATPRRSPVVSPRSAPPSIFNMEAYFAERLAAHAAAAADPTANTEEVDKPSEKDKDKDKDKEASKGGNEGKAASSTPADGGAKSGRRNREDGTDAPMLASSVLEAAAAECARKIQEEEAKLDPSKKTISVLIGEGLISMNVRIGEMVQTWAKRGNEPLNKLEFRQNVRRLLDKPDSKQIDALFESLDEDGGGTLDLAEIRSALKRLHTAAVIGAKEAAEVRSKIERIQEVQTLASEALEITLTVEKATMGVEELSSNLSVSARMGAQIIAKRLKPADVVQKFDANGDGKLDMGEFRQNVKALGVQAESSEIDQLFNSLDTNNSGSLDMGQIKVALKTLCDDASATDKNIRDLKKEIADQSKSARAAQLQYRKQQKLADADAAKEAEAAAALAEERAVAAAAERELRTSRAQETRKAIQEAKAAFEAKVAAKRSKVFGYYDVAC